MAVSIEDLQEICGRLPAVTEDIKWVNQLCFCVGNKMFMMVSLDEVPVTCSFKTAKDGYNMLSSRNGFRPAPYLARAHWVSVDDISRIRYQEWEVLIHLAYTSVRNKLPKKTLNELGLN